MKRKEKLIWILEIGFLMFFSSCTTLDSILGINDEEKEEKKQLDYLVDYKNQGLIDLVSQEFNSEIKYEDLDKIITSLNKVFTDNQKLYSENSQNMEKCYQISNILSQIEEFCKKINDYEKKSFDSTGQKTVEYFNSKYPNSYNFMKKVDILKTEVLETNNNVFLKSRAFEAELLEKYIYNKYAIKINGNISLFGGNMLSMALMSSSVDKTKLYIINNQFTVLQSADDGYLLNFMDPYYNTYTVFMESKEIYPDNYRFNKNVFVVNDGFFEYDSLLGRRKVWKFLQIIIDKKFYFL